MNQDICTRCVMDVSAREISFDSNGVCNFCRLAEAKWQIVQWEKEDVEKFLSKIGKMMVFDRNKYDCLIGLSGGVDSSFALYNAVKLGLRPLAFSLDNGWNDPKADENIMRLVEGLKVPFIRYNIDIYKFKELQAAFLSAGVPNIEIPTDHVLMAATYELADRYGIKHIITGGNVATESIMPPSWGYNARDLVHIKAIYKKFTGKKLEGLPTCSLWQFNKYQWIKGIRFFPLLDYIYYNRDEAIEILAKEFGYQHPGEKHCESTWTAWFQNYYLFEKFGYDKRKAHFSSLIVSGQMTRDEALFKLQADPVYPELGIESKIMKYKRHEHDEYPKDEKLYNFIGKVIKFFR